MIEFYKIPMSLRDDFTKLERQLTVNVGDFHYLVRCKLHSLGIPADDMTDDDIEKLFVWVNSRSDFDGYYLQARIFYTGRELLTGSELL